MKLIVAGSRHLTEKDIPKNVPQLVKDKWGETPKLIIHGGCRGPDVLISKQFSIPHKVFKPDWNKYGRAAGPIRNEQMAQEGTHLFIVWDGKSRGSASMIREMSKLNKPVYSFKVM